MRDETAADASTGEDEPVHIFGHEGAQRNIVGLGLERFLLDPFCFFRVRRVDVDGKGYAADSVVEASSVFQIIITDGIPTVDATSFTRSDLFPRSEDFHVLPGAAFFPKHIDHRVILTTSFDSRFRHVRRVDGGNVVLMIRHHRVEAIVNFENRGTSITRIDPCGTELGEKIALPASQTPHACDVIHKGSDFVRFCSMKESHQGKRLGDTITGSTEIESASCLRSEITVPGGVDKGICRPDFATRFGFGQDCRETARVIRHGTDDTGEKSNVDSGLQQHVLE